MERDAAVDAVLTAETLLAQFVALIPRLRSMLPADVSTAMGEAQGLYPALWAELDRARATLRERGVDVPGLDAVRARQPAAMLGFDVHADDRTGLRDATSAAAFMLGGLAGAVASAAIDVVGSVGAKHGEADQHGLADARAAITALRGAMPDVDWKAVQRAESLSTARALDDFARARRKKLLIWLAGLAVAVLVGVGIVVVLQRSQPPSPEEAYEAEQARFRADQDELRELNDVLRDTPCNATAAERRVTLLRTRGQAANARKLATVFLDRCGENATLRAAAASPR